MGFLWFKNALTIIINLEVQIKNTLTIIIKTKRVYYQSNNNKKYIKKN
jgi:hypothetical protein